MVQELSTWQEAVTVASPAIAAVAAVASWASVVQARKLAREEASPLLMMQKIITPGRMIGAAITNAGGGAARGATILLSYPPYRVEEAIGAGFLFPGQNRFLSTNIPFEGEGIETDIMAFCRDRDGFPHFWNADEKHKVFKTRFRRRPQYGHALGDVFHELHPKVNFGELERVGGTVIDPEAERRAS